MVMASGSQFHRYRFPQGVRYGGTGSHGNAHFEISISSDDEGHIGRQCPDCQQVFRVHAEDYDDLPDDLRLWCVYCGHHEDHSEFITDQQLNRVERVVEDYAVQMVHETLDRSLGRLARRSRNSPISISYQPKRFYPKPLPGVYEESTVRERRCQTCALRYAVFGEHRFCPVCGPLAPPVVASDAIAAETTRLDALTELPEPTLAELREQGVLDRAYADTIKNLVGIVETLAEAVFRSRVGTANDALRGRGNIFQRLDDMADLFSNHGVTDLRDQLPEDWPNLQSAWAVRHVLTHNDGIVDDKYLAADPTNALSPGQRVRVSEASARQTIVCVTRLCSLLADAWTAATDSFESRVDSHSSARASTPQQEPT